MISLCIFDLDGTLINSLYDLADAMNHALSKNGLPVIERDRYKLLVGNGISVLADRAMGAAEGSESELKDRVLKDFNEYYSRHNKDMTRPYEGIEELLAELEGCGVRYAVLSNKPDHFTKELIHTLFPERSFACIWGKKEGYPTKPDPASVLAVIDRTGVRKDECIYIGDSNVDILTAKNAGLKSIGVSWGFRSVEELTSAGCGFIAHRPGDILDLIRGANNV